MITRRFLDRLGRCGVGGQCRSDFDEGAWVERTGAHWRTLLQLQGRGQRGSLAGEAGRATNRMKTSPSDPTETPSWYSSVLAS